MPTLKKSIKAVRDALAATLLLEQQKQFVERSGLSYQSNNTYRQGRLDGLRLARRIIDGIFPQ